MSSPGKREHSADGTEIATDRSMKKLKTDSAHSESIRTESRNRSDESKMFSDFVVDDILGENSQNKVAFIHGHYRGSDQEAVVVVEKTPFSESTIKAILNDDSHTTCTLKNDIYHTLDLVPPQEYSGIKTTLIYPATQKHISKYRSQEMFILQETAEDYENITTPFIDEEQFSIQWVYNILEKKKEADRIVYEDTDPDKGFILLPDMKWDRKQMEDLYLVAIVHQHGLKSLRDLSKDHLPLLRNILHQGTEAIREKYSIGSSKLRIYLHYQPSYYHLHVHFTHLKFQAPGSGVERAHLLTDVIDNIQLDGDYYSKKTLSFTARAGDKLYEKFKVKGRVTS